MTDEEILRTIREEIEGPAFITSEVADELDMTVEGVRNRLEKLHKEGKLGKKKPGERTTIWYDKSDYRSSDLEA